ncbi:MAG: MBL fold metallo-hydrolase [Desulfobacteraceae bacterium]|nr:MBL fold metallo-hydrolase [Desulfobacteraceae bacterium]
MLYEIDFLPVGEGESSGDAICLRYSIDKGNSWVVGVIDGGTQTSGEAVCTHIREYYGTETIDFAVCTHPDQDHASGLSVVMDEMTVNTLMMHCPWDYVDHLFEYVSDGRVTKESLSQRLKDGLPYAFKLYELANEKGIPIHHAFSDNENHGIPFLHTIGPSGNYYLEQVVNFRSITDITEDVVEKDALLRSIMAAARKAVNWISESWDDEKLVDPEDDATSSENNSSVILFFDFNGKKLLFTGDAGVPALEKAADKLETLGFSLQDFSFVQAPHHGSKRNTGPTILNRLIGYPRQKDTDTIFTTFISASKEGEPKHPNKRVVNAFVRRGGKVIATQGSTKCHYSNGVLIVTLIEPGLSDYFEQLEIFQHYFDQIVI